MRTLSVVFSLFSGQRHTMDKLIVFCLIVVFSTACSTTSPTENPESTATPMPVKSFRVIGYATDASIPEIIPYDKLTHINYAFLIPNSDGTLAHFANAWKLEAIVKLSHENDCKVLISVGGWGWDEQFETLAADADSRSRFVDALVDFAADHNLDGIDMDWEYPDPGDSAQNFLALMTELRAALPEDTLLTAAVIAHGDAVGLGTSNEA